MDVEDDAHAPPVEPSQLAQVSAEIVRLYKEPFGRGPESAATTWAGPDALLCTLHKTLTPAVRNLVSLGEHERLRDTRLFVEHAAEAEFRAVVERITGRRVEAFIIGLDVARDVAAELFYLAPAEGHHPAPDDDSGEA
jgi:uncharacterized protein YbcI